MLCRSEILTHSRPVSRLAITESLVVSCGEDCSLTVIRLLTDGSLLVSHLLQGHVSRVRCVSVDGSLLLSGSDDRSAKVWEVASDSCGAVRTLSGHAWPVSGVCLAGGLAVTADTSTVRLWACPAGLLLRTISGLAGCQEVRLDLTAGCLLLSSHHANILCFSLQSDSESAAAWEFRPDQPADSSGGQVRLSLGHSSLAILTSTSNSHYITVLDFWSSTIPSSYCSVL